MTENTKNADSSQLPTTAPSHIENVLDLIALVSLLTVITGVYLTSRPEVFAAATGMSAGLFTTWRGRQNSD